MPAWMSYVVLVSLLLGLAALALEGSARIQQLPTRWLWATSMIASLLLPVVIHSICPQIISIVGPAIPESVYAPRQMGAASSLSWLSVAFERLPASPGLDRLLLASWGTASAILLMSIIVGSAQLSRCRRRWERRNVAGVTVHVSEDIGPAVVGLLNPHIVVPRWLMQCPANIQELVIAHEQSHLEARDARLVAIALSVLICMPWNLPLWWQLRRLRFALEIDCDARVLGQGYEVSQYGETLIAVGERQSATKAVVAALAEPRSLLEQRIRNMVRRKTKFARPTAVGLACLGIACAVGAAEIGPPNGGTSGKSTVPESVIDTKTLDNHVGSYRMNEASVMTITRVDQQLNAQRPTTVSNNAQKYRPKRGCFATGTRDVSGNSQAVC